MYMKSNHPKNKVGEWELCEICGSPWHFHEISYRGYIKYFLRCPIRIDAEGRLPEPTLPTHKRGDDRHIGLVILYGVCAGAYFLIGLVLLLV